MDSVIGFFPIFSSFKFYLLSFLRFLNIVLLFISYGCIYTEAETK